MNETAEPEFRCWCEDNGCGWEGTVIRKEREELTRRLNEGEIDVADLLDRGGADARS